MEKSNAFSELSRMKQEGYLILQQKATGNPAQQESRNKEGGYHKEDGKKRPSLLHSLTRGYHPETYLVNNIHKNSSDER